MSDPVGLGPKCHACGSPWVRNVSHSEGLERIYQFGLERQERLRQYEQAWERKWMEQAKESYVALRAQEDQAELDLEWFEPQQERRSA